MTEFTIKTAGRVIRVRALHEATRRFCGEYLWDGAPDFTVTVEPEDIASEREKSAREDALAGLPVRQFPDAYLETLAVQRKIAQELFRYDTLLFHGSVVALDGAAYLFTAISGTGKSTHTRLWREVFGDRVVMVNDDKPFLRLTEQGVLACGSPWNGKHGLGENTSVPLKAICILERGQENVIRPIPAKEALLMLLQQSCRPQDPRQMPKYLELLDMLSERVSFYHLACNMETQAAVVAYEGMSQV